MPRRPKVNVKKISRKAVKSYGYVRPNPGVRAIAAINGTGSYRSARSEMSGLTPAQKRARAKRAVSRTTRNSSMPRRIIRRNKYKAPRTYAGRRSVSFLVPRARGSGKRRISFRAASGSPEKGPISFMATNRRRRPRRNSKRTSRLRRVLRAPIRRVVRNRRRVRRNNKLSGVAARKRSVRRNRRRSPVRRRRVVRNKRRSPVRRRRVVRNKRRSPVRRRRVVRNKRRSPVRRRRVVRNKRRSPVRRRRVVRNKRRSPVRRRRVVRNRRRIARRGPVSAISRRFRRNGGVAMEWIRTGGFIAAGVISHKLFSGFLKNMLVSKEMTPESIPDVDAQADGVAPASGLGFLPASMVPYAGIISGGIAAAAGVYLVTKTVKDQKTRQLVAGGMVASFLHTLIVDLLKKSSPSFAAQVSGLGSNANAVRLSAMYGVNGPTSIEPMYQQINGMGEYFSSGVNGLGSTPWAAAGMGEYFSSGVNGVGEYFSSGVQGLGEYGSNPDIMQAAAGYGAVDIGDNSNHLDPSSDLDRALSIAEAAAGVGSLGPMQAAAGLGNPHVGRVGSSQTWIPGESDPSIWAGVRPVERSQMQTAMIPAGSLQSGGGQGIFG